MKISKMQIAIYLMIAAGFILGMAFYDKLPESMATHWNIKGQVDDYMHKSDGAYFGPVLMVILAAAFMLVPRIPSRRINFKKFRIFYENSSLLTMAIIFIGHIWVLTYNLSIKVDENLPRPLIIVILLVATIFPYIIYKKIKAGGIGDDAEEMGTDSGSGDNTWDNLKEGYLQQVEKSLMKISSPRKKEVLEDVACHLDQKFG